MQEEQDVKTDCEASVIYRTGMKYKLHCTKPTPLLISEPY